LYVVVFCLHDIKHRKMPNKPKKEKVRNIFCYWNTFWLIKCVMRWYDMINISVEREYVVGK